ncbi:hypothetical protein F2P56_024261 [Juglans regia]|uniref:Uncharacterized protein n=1 Tax=Juglans regia TaxID=51240 RepID=A0A833TU99_JUGRE|nr:hypothetical protein F2P56_024261 [Juglans regia]
MHHLAGGKSNLVDSGSETNNLVSRGNNDHPLCPKPRRLGAAIPEFLKPQRCSKHSQFNTDGRKDILNIISEKMEGKLSAMAAHHHVFRGLLREERVILWFMMCSLFIRWNLFHHLREPSSPISLDSPLLPQYEFQK